MQSQVPGKVPEMLQKSAVEKSRAVSAQSRCSCPKHGHGLVAQEEDTEPLGCSFSRQAATRFCHYQCCGHGYNKSMCTSLTSLNLPICVLFYCLCALIYVYTLADPEPNTTPSCFQSHAVSNTMRG